MSCVGFWVDAIAMLTIAGGLVALFVYSLLGDWGASIASLNREAAPPEPKLTDDTRKYCEDCVWYRDVLGSSCMCPHFDTTGDPVTRVDDRLKLCSSARRPWHGCGPEGKYWERRCK